VSGCSWSECPDQRGITVRMCVEWVSESAWNPQLGAIQAFVVLHRSFPRADRVASASGSPLQQHRPALDWSGLDDSHAGRGSLLRYSFGALSLRKGASKSGLPMVLLPSSGGARPWVSDEAGVVHIASAYRVLGVANPSK